MAVLESGTRSQSSRCLADTMYTQSQARHHRSPHPWRSGRCHRSEAEKVAMEGEVEMEEAVATASVGMETAEVSRGMAVERASVAAAVVTARVAAAAVATTCEARSPHNRSRTGKTGLHCLTHRRRTRRRLQIDTRCCTH